MPLGNFYADHHRKQNSQHYLTLLQAGFAVHQIYKVKDGATCTHQNVPRYQNDFIVSTFDHILSS